MARENRLLLERDRPPAPRPGVETDIIGELRNLASSLPEGVASLRISRIKGHPEWAEPAFEVTPTNRKAARVGGYAVADDLYLTVGEAEREFVGFAKGGNIQKRINWQTELRWIWEAVISGEITQKHYFDSTGRIIGWATRFQVHGTEIVFRNGRRSPGFFRHEIVKIVAYEPYYNV